MTINDNNKNCDTNNCGNSCGNSNKEFDSFIESIDEEIKAENWKLLWDKYGKLITYASSTILIAAAVFGMWQKQDLADREAISSKFSLVQSLIISGNIQAALPTLNEIANVSKKDYAVLASLEKAALFKTAGDKQALSFYKSIVDDKKANKLLRDLAYIFYVNSALDLMSAKEITENIDSFIKNLQEKYIGKTWDLIAKETLAFCYIKYGKNDQAKSTLESLAKTKGIPQAMLERTKTLLHSIGE